MLKKLTTADRLEMLAQHLEELPSGAFNMWDRTRCYYGHACKVFAVKLPNHPLGSMTIHTDISHLAELLDLSENEAQALYSRNLSSLNFNSPEATDAKEAAAHLREVAARCPC